MISLRKFGMLSLGFGALLALAGCQTGGGGSMNMDSGDAKAVTCTKCQVTWVQVPATGMGHHAQKLTTVKSMECPDCKDAVENFFATGKLEHTCKSCGVTMEVCKVH